MHQTIIKKPASFVLTDTSLERAGIALSLWFGVLAGVYRYL
jgi:hypothetical protein